MIPKLAGFLLAATILTTVGCAWKATDKCYLPMNRYQGMKTLFEETGSMQRVEQAMEDEQWTNCERRQCRYLLAKDLELEELTEEAAY